MHAIDNVEVPEIDDYYTIKIAVEDIVDFKVSSLRVIESHIVYIKSVSEWTAVRPGEYPKNFASIALDYAIYESKEGGIVVPVRLFIKTFSQSKDSLHHAVSLANTYNITNPLILCKSKGDLTTLCVMEISEPRYLCFKAIPKKKWKNLEQITVDYFWEIISYILASDGRTAFEVKMNL
ncbi:hypothetical protein DRO97_02440 [Archaeoglobales archaeon]|nr:MAG: hypothetical protein DRO97_02440 [Archaeoglobales archaeon]